MGGGRILQALKAEVRSLVFAVKALGSHGRILRQGGSFSDSPV